MADEQPRSIGTKGSTVVQAVQQTTEVEDAVPLTDILCIFTRSSLLHMSIRISLNYRIRPNRVKEPNMNEEC